MVREKTLDKLIANTNKMIAICKSIIKSIENIEKSMKEQKARRIV